MKKKEVKKVPEKKVAEKPVAKPVEKTAKAEPKIEVPVAWAPSLGEKVLHNGNGISLLSFDPLEATKFSIRNDVLSEDSYQLKSLEGIQPIDKDELFRRTH